MFNKGDWVTTIEVDTIPFKLEEDQKIYTLYRGNPSQNQGTYTVVIQPRTKEQIPTDLIRLATEADFIKSHQRMIEKRDAVLKSMQAVTDLHGEFLRDTRNFHITD